MNESSQAGADSICAEMNDLMHDYEVVSRISDLVTQLKGTYEVIIFIIFFYIYIYNWLMEFKFLFFF